VSELSRQAGISRQTLTAWRGRGEQAVLAAFTPRVLPQRTAVERERLLLTLWAGGHASERGIQACLAELGQPVSLGTVSAVLQTAERRALALLGQPVPATPRALALDELYGNDRRGAYLTVVDARSGVVWATNGPSAVDHETWVLLLWQIQDRGLCWEQMVSDGGGAIAQACRAVAPQYPHQRDVWHVLHHCSQVQGRLDRHVARLTAQTNTVGRQAARVAAGQPVRGRQPQADPAAHGQALAQAQRTAAGLRYLSSEARTLLDSVVVVGGRVLAAAARQAELQALLALLGELAAAAPSAMAAELAKLLTSLSQALPALLAFTTALDAPQQQVDAELGPEALALVAWAWQRRAPLAWDRVALLASLPVAWRDVVAPLLVAWEQAVRASSLVENWHSVLRPHLAVHRTLSPGRLALLAVWHNHRVAPRGSHAGTSPLQRSGLAAPTDWLVALGYPPASGSAPAAVPAPVTGGIAA